MEVSTNISSMALIWGNLRNVLDFDNLKIPGEFSLVGSEKGEFPISSYNPIYLEIPKINEKYNLTGRFNWSSCETNRNISWQFNRMIHLPIYNSSENINLNDLKNIFQNWNEFSIPQNIPCLNLGIQIKGTYTSDGRDAQLATVLLVWPNGISRILQLDYFEGALDDCCTPEWYIKSFGILSLSKAIEKFIEIHKTKSDWFNSVYSILLNPATIIKTLNGSRIDYPKKGFQSEWEYENFNTFNQDLKVIFDNIKYLFT